MVAEELVFLRANGNPFLPTSMLAGSFGDMVSANTVAALSTDPVLLPPGDCTKAVEEIRQGGQNPFSLSSIHFRGADFRGIHELAVAGEGGCPDRKERVSCEAATDKRLHCSALRPIFTGTQCVFLTKSVTVQKFLRGFSVRRRRIVQKKGTRTGMSLVFNGKRDEGVV